MMLGVLLAVLALADEARAAPVRLMVSISNNLGDPTDVPLRYADADARRFHALMLELGQVQPARAYLLGGATVEQVRAAFTEVRGRAAELAAAGAEVTLFIYVSAHAQGGQLHLGGGHLPLAELRELAMRVAAPLRVLLLDTCESGIVARRKGGRLVSGYELNLTRLPLRGEVLISSSGPAESSEEWESLAGSLFTHHLLTGLRGDADVNGDGQVTVSEAYSYAYRRTVSASARGSQHPVADIDLSGAGEVVLTEPLRHRSAVILPPAAEGTFTVASQPEPDVLLEVDKRAGRALRLAVPPGRYLVRKRLGTRVALASLELPYGGELTVDERSMVERSWSEVALKGGYVDVRASTLLLVGGFQSGPIPQTGGRWRAGAGYRHTFGEWWWKAGVSAQRATYAGVGLDISELGLLAQVSVGWRYLGWPLAPYVGLGLSSLTLRQSFTRDQEERIQRAFGQKALPERWGLGLGPVGVAGVELPLAGNFLALLEASAELRYLPLDGDTSPWRAGAGVEAALGWRF
ncbi:peptidase C14 caspase catalytic subunit p20 [Archangium gephyra]|uniref:Peptidase C14 caspase catalytic subunit p20 n=1 Tax=Archangium gephyra TaxID=48 RepID=A0AAC8TF76_9BACT|nr:peptidase C14 caspase catalytic subunit p20 [Archangium gephyra]